jgi:hypothetical protein
MPEFRRCWRRCYCAPPNVYPIDGKEENEIGRQYSWRMKTALALRRFHANYRSSRQLRTSQNAGTAKICAAANMKRVTRFLIFVTYFVIPFAAQQSPPRKLVLEVIETDGSVRGSMTYVYLRVFSDGSTEAHDLRRLDLRAVQLRSGKLKPSTYQDLDSITRSQWFLSLPEQTGPFYGETDTAVSWDLTSPRGDSLRRVHFVNFNPYATMYIAKKAFPRELEKFVCLVWKARGEAVQDAEAGIAAGCQQFHFTP